MANCLSLSSREEANALTDTSEIGNSGSFPGIALYVLYFSIQAMMTKTALEIYYL